MPEGQDGRRAPVRGPQGLVGCALARHVLFTELHGLHGGTRLAIVVRDATSEDVEAIFALGIGDPAFSVSEHISFYERGELVEWINLDH